MYKKKRNHQFSFTDFNQPLGFKMNPDNRWVRKAELIPWDEIEEKYAALFPSKTGMPAKPLRMALGSLLIQKQYDYSDRELVEQLTENPYYQYFIGLHGYQQNAPFVPSLLVEFRKRLTEEVLNEINEMIIDYNKPDDPDGNAGGGDNSEDSSDSNSGTLILDATCAPQNIAYPQDINLLNEARENLECIIDRLCYDYNTDRPRTYRINARKDYLALAKRRRRSGNAIKKAIKKQLQYVRRDLRYIDEYISRGMTLSTKDAARLSVIKVVFEQQSYMYEHKVHSVPDRIVSISQPYIRPIVRGKAKQPTEFGVKLDLSVDEFGMARLEKQSFDAYNECDVLQKAVEHYRERTGHYPERILADTIYRNRNNLSYCKSHGIRLSGPALGRPKKNCIVDKKQEYIDAVDRIEVERKFSLAKRCFGLGLIKTKLDTTTMSSVSLSVIAMNVDRLMTCSFFDFIRYISESVFRVVFRIFIADTGVKTRLEIETL